MRLLTITYKRCYRVNGKHYSTGGSPKEFNTLAENLDFHLLAEFLEKDKVEPAWEEIDPRVKCFSLGKIKQIATFPPAISASFRAAGLAEEIVKKHNIDIVLMKGPSEVSMAPLLSLKKYHVPLIYHYSLDWIQDVIVSGKKTRLRRFCLPYFVFARYYRQAIEKFFFPRADALATVASPYAKALDKYKPGRVYLLPSTFTTSKTQVVSDLSPKNIDENHFLFVGRIDRNKNLQLIAHALKILNRKIPETKIKIDIIGEGEEYWKVLKLAEELDVAGHFNYIGYVKNDELQRFYRKAYALLLPSFSELLPKVVIESFTAATPVIAARVGGIPDMLDDGKNGYFIDPFSPESLAEKMEKIIKEKGHYPELQKNAIVTALKFSRESTLERWQNTLEGIIKSYNSKVK